MTTSSGLPIEYELALGAFTALFGAVATIIVSLTKRDSKEAKVAAREAVRNTEPISNGFALGVTQKLDTIIEHQNKMDESFRKHLEWHLTKER